MHGNLRTSWKAALRDMERAGFEFLGEELIYPRLYCQLFSFGAEAGVKRLPRGALSRLAFGVTG